MLKRMILALSLMGSLGACGWVSRPPLENGSALDAIVERQTSAQDVRQLLGDPAYVFNEGNGNAVWGYREYQGSALFSNVKFTSVILEIHDGIVVSKDVSRF